MPGVGRKMMVMLGLVDDDEYDYDPYEEQAPVSTQAPARRMPQPAEMPEPALSATPGVRTLPRETADASGGHTLRPAVVRPITAAQSAKVHIVAPGRFSDAQEIGDRFKSAQPVIVNLTQADRELARRMIDFCSGVTYALGGSMDKVADQVFLLTPSNVELSADEKRRLQERGLYS
jgi:cell division inhibitor SepF